MTTRWSVVRTAGQTGPDSRRALAELCETYWPPVYAFLLRKVRDVERAKDLTQGFFCDLLARGDLGVADPGLGRFRSYLLKGAQNFAAKDYAHRTRAKRGGDAPQISLDALREANGDLADIADHRTPESVFEQRWAETVLRQAMNALAEEYATRGRREVFETLRIYLEDTGETRPYRDTARRLSVTEGAVKVSVFRLRRRFGELLLAEVGQTLDAETDPMEEVQALRNALRGSSRSSSIET